MESHQLVTENIVAGSDGLRDLDHPAVIVLDQLIITPGTRDVRVVDQTNAVDLEELERGLVNCLATVTTVGEIVHDRTMVRLGPFCPLDVDAVTCLYSDVTLGVGRVLMANDVGRGVVVGSYEPVTSVGSSPCGDSGGIWHVREGVDIKALVVDTVDDDVGDMTVGCDLGG